MNPVNYGGGKSKHVRPIAVTIGGHRGMGCTDSAFAQEQQAHLTRPAENTLASFRAAFDAKVDCIETDLVATKDDQLVLIHSGDLRRHVPESLLPEGKRYADQLTLREIQELAGKGAVKIPALRELLALTKQERPPGSLLLNLEIKDVQGTDRPRKTNPSVPALALKAIRDSGFPLEDVRFSSFSLDAVAEIKRLEPSARVGMLFDVPGENGGDAGKKLFGHPDDPETYRCFTPEAVGETLRRVPDLEALHPEIRSVTPEMVKLARQNNLALASWGWQEKSPLDPQDPVFAEAAVKTIALCHMHGVPLLIITDYAEDMREFVRRQPHTGSA